MSDWLAGMGLLLGLCDARVVTVLRRGDIPRPLAVELLAFVGSIASLAIAAWCFHAWPWYVALLMIVCSAFACGFVVTRRTLAAASLMSPLVSGATIAIAIALWWQFREID